MACLLQLLANTNKAKGGPVVGIEPMENREGARGGVANPVTNWKEGGGARALSSMTNQREERTLGGGAVVFSPNRTRPGAGYSLGCPMRNAAEAGLSREGAGGGGMVSRG